MFENLYTKLYKLETGKFKIEYNGNTKPYNSC